MTDLETWLRRFLLGEQEHTATHWSMIAGGTGITPILQVPAACNDAAITSLSCQRQLMLAREQQESVKE